MSYSSMTLKNVMGGCELVDLKPPKTEKSLLIDFSLIGINLHDLQKNLISQNNKEDESISTAVILSEFSGECCEDQSKDNNNNVCSEEHLDDKVIKSAAESEAAKVHCNLELFDLNANKVIQAEPNDLPQPVFTSIQNFYETFDVSDQIESISNIESTADTPSSASTFDSYNPDLVITYVDSSTVYDQNLENTSNVTSPSTEYCNELDFIPNAVSPKDSKHPLEKIMRLIPSVDESNESLEINDKKRKNSGRVSKKKPSVEKNISCSRCSKKFRTAAHLKVHFMVHMDSECVHLCTICDRRFCHRGALTLHARKHTAKSAFDITS